MNEKFIVALDKDTMWALRRSGYIELPSLNSQSGYVFVNETQQKFDNTGIDYSKVRFTNILRFNKE